MNYAIARVVADRPQTHTQANTIPYGVCAPRVNKLKSGKTLGR